MITSTEEAALSTAQTQPKKRGVTARIVRKAWGYTEMKIAATVFIALALLTVFGPFLIDASATKMNVANKFLPPIFMEGGKLPHFFGTDQLGRDLLLRSLIGLRNAFAIGVASVIGIFVLGCAIGIYAGYRGGWTDVILMRLTDVQMSIPVVILAITILGMSRPSPATIIAVLVLASWPVYARVSRGVTLAERQKEYVRAAKILGASDLRIMVRHIAPQCLAADRLRRRARRGPHDDLRSHLRLHRHRHPAADADLRNHHFRRHPISAERLVDHHRPRHPAGAGSRKPQSDGRRPRARAQPHPAGR